MVARMGDRAGRSVGGRGCCERWARSAASRTEGGSSRFCERRSPATRGCTSASRTPSPAGSAAFEKYLGRHVLRTERAVDFDLEHAALPLHRPHDPRLPHSGNRARSPAPPTLVAALAPFLRRAACALRRQTSSQLRRLPVPRSRRHPGSPPHRPSSIPESRSRRRAGRYVACASAVWAMILLSGCARTQLSDISRIGPYVEQEKLLTGSTGWTDSMKEVEAILRAEGIPTMANCRPGLCSVLVYRMDLYSAREALRRAGSKVWIAPTDAKPSQD
jgi:hypothetical protein